MRFRLRDCRAIAGLSRAAASIAKAANIHNAPVDAEVLQPVLAREPSLAASPVARTALT